MLLGTCHLPNYQLQFNKLSRDGSGKCHIIKSQNHLGVYVAVYSINQQEKVMLDEAEGLGNGYHEEAVTVVLDGKSISGLIYVADKKAMQESLYPYDWYRELVSLGAQYHSFPSDYIKKVQSIPVSPDPNHNRAQQGWDLVARLKVDSA
jgi:hypothetical protein